jgi:hypothetical protein
LDVQAETVPTSYRVWATLAGPRLRPTPIIAATERECLLKARTTAVVSGFTGEITIAPSGEEPRDDAKTLRFEGGRQVGHGDAL